MKKIKVSIQGMHCASCAINIEKSLRKVGCVKDVTVSAVTNKAFLECDSDVKKEDIKKAVAKVGNYKVIDIEE